MYLNSYMNHVVQNFYPEPAEFEQIEIVINSFVSHLRREISIMTSPCVLWVNATQNKPFQLTISYHHPHQPYMTLFEYPFLLVLGQMTRPFHFTNTSPFEMGFNI
jgi:hypothetical protein